MPDENNKKNHPVKSYLLLFLFVFIEYEAITLFIAVEIIETVYLNVAGGLRLDEPSADLSIAMALISGITDRVIPDGLIAFGEIGLSGEVRAVSHIDYRVKEAVRLGFTKIVLPKKNISAHLSVPKGVELVGITNIYEALVQMQLRVSAEG